MAAKKGFKKLSVDLTGGTISLYVGSKVRVALEEITTDMTLYHGVRLAEVMQAVYNQGQKDGRREVVEEFERIRANLNYLPPGQPKKKKLKSLI